MPIRPNLLTPAVAALLFAGCLQSISDPDLYSLGGSTMGTTYSIKVVARGLSTESQSSLEQQTIAAIEDVNRKMSTYLDDSELSQLNRASGGAAIAVSPETLYVFEQAQQVGALTAGAFDITVGPLVNAWGFGPDKQRRDPPADEVDRLRALTGWDKITIDAGGITKAADEVYCDLSAVAKGYAVDRAAETIEALGYVDYMVEIGGEVRTRGHNQSGELWRIAVEEPNAAARTLHRVLPLDDLAMATSGDYRNYYEQDGVRISHTIDPRTGRPVSHRLASVTVLDRSCLRADAFATALMVLGEDEGLRLANDLEIPALLLVRDDDGGLDDRTSPAFDRLFP